MMSVVSDVFFLCRYLVLSSMSGVSEDADVDAAGSNASYSVADIADVKAFETSLANERKRNADAASATSTRMGSEASDAETSGLDEGNGRREVAGSAEELQHRIIRFLGHLGGRSHMLLKPLREVLQDGHGLSWAPSLPAHAVSVDIGLSAASSSSGPGGQSVSLRIDQLLPRVSEMALQSSDRDTKHASCELLHALACISCGLENKHRCSFEELYVQRPSLRDIFSKNESARQAASQLRVVLTRCEFVRRVAFWFDCASCCFAGMPSFSQFC